MAKNGVAATEEPAQTMTTIEYVDARIRALEDSLVAIQNRLAELRDLRKALT